MGYRGTGKTTVAGAVAEAVGWSWVDTDDLVEQAAGKTISQLFAEEGEPAFRDREEKAIALACARTKTVVALGGGTILREANRERLRAAGPVVWLRASAAELAERLAADDTTGKRRPNLTAHGGLAEIEQVLAERTPIYQGCADFEVETESKTPSEIARLIANRFLAP